MSYTPGSIPETEHWAVVNETTTQVRHEGDERSRTHPGHGYPAYTEDIHSLSYEAFPTESAALEYMATRQSIKLRPTNYRLLHVIPFKTTVKVVAERAQT